jgi:hypothetical protein
MKKQLDALYDLLNDQFSDWSDIEYDYNQIETHSSGSIIVTVQIDYSVYDISFTQNFEVTQELEVLIELPQTGTEPADSKWFWIMLAPKLF